MDGARAFLDAVEQAGLVRGNLLGMLHTLIGRRISTADGGKVSTGLSWRDVAAELKRRRWEVDLAAELGIDPSKLPARDRQRLWYSVISSANVGSAQAIEAGNQFAKLVSRLGFQVGPAPGTK
jgi:hypothetical protein